MKLSFLGLFMALLWTITSAFAQQESVETKVSDVRVLIDMSGSMKKNDPDNLRIPALKLITQLIPEGEKGGVWTFGQYVNMLVKQGPVDKVWKENAYKAADGINSKGLFTNIEAVLEKASWDWKTADPKANRSLILLTDGVVDIAKDPEANAKSRSRILNEIVPKLTAAGATVHTIALSNDADKAFLRQLSSATDGWFEVTEDASKLERLFLKLFEKSVPVTSVPLTDNRVLVDDRISELTLLVFRKEGAAKGTTLMLPNGGKIDQSKKVDNVRWRNEKRYDLITIDKPMPGSWSVDAELDPDNRVMVVTDLKVRASRLPNIMMGDDVMSYFVELVENGEVIRKQQFLDFVHVSLDRTSDGANQKTIAMTDDGKEVDQKAGDGRFSARVGGGLPPGQYQYDMQVDGMTFKRSKRDVVRVVDKPVAVTIKEEKPGDPAQYSLTLTPFAELIKLDKLLIETTVAKEGGAEAAVTIPRAGPSEWRLDMKVNAGEIYNVKIAIQSERLDGRAVSYDLGSFRLGSGSMDVGFDKPETPPAAPQPVAPIKLETPAPPPEAKAEPEQHAPEHKAEEPKEAEAEKPAEEHADKGEEEAAEESPNWIMVAVKVIGLNGILIGIGFFVYRKWFRKPKEAPAEEEAKEKKAEGKGDDKH